mmetsp:Transcript_3748/g.9465  ORF Transcript_3748/g.9465 Transcript_3748/m.9465 type:complete len:857 (+) Transcript_3748:102-2672(+)
MAASPPPGLETLFITGSTQGTHKIKTGEDLTEAQPYCFVSKQALVEEIQFKGQISDFYTLKDKLKKYAPDQVMVVWDVEEVYGNNFLVAVTEKARDAQLETYKVAAAEAAAAVEMASVSAQEEAEIAETDVQVVSRLWVSMGSEKEIKKSTVTAKRLPIQMAITRARSEFGQAFKLADRDAHDSFVDCRPFKDPNFDLRRATRDESAQLVAPLAAAHTQTAWFRPLNKGTQAEAQQLESRALLGALGAPSLKPFLADARARLEKALQQNELVDIFRDDLAVLADDDASLGNKHDNDVKELQSFSRNQFSHERVVTATHWKPGNAGVVGVSLARKQGFEERVEVAGRVHTGHVLLWSFADPITPQFALEAPQDVLTFVFNPSFPNLVLGGVGTGQLVLWDLTDPPLVNNPGSGFGVGAGVGEAGAAGAEGVSISMADGDATGSQTQHLVPCALSAIEYSHKRGITDIQWLPQRHEMTSGCRMRMEEGTGAWQSWQCCTIASDGQVLFWDVRSARKETYLSASGVSKKENRRHPTDKEATEAAELALKKDEILWVPLARLDLKKLDGSGDLSCMFLELCGIPYGAKFYAATEEGELAMVELAHVPTGGADDVSAEIAGVKFVHQWHLAAAVAMKRSPFFRDIYLTVADWSCHVWKEGVAAPMFSSPYSSERLTAGCWSPTRAGVLFLAKADGAVDVWDLADRTHEPSTTFNVGSAAVTSLSMFAQQSAQLLAAGDDQGTLHLMEIPRNLRRAPATEKAAMAAFFDREVLRVAYVQRRKEQRELEAAEAAANPEAATEAAPVQPGEGGEEEDGFDAKLEAEYSVLEASFKAELGLGGKGSEEGSRAASPRTNGDAAGEQ